jgi:hypothetical protein
MKQKMNDHVVWPASDFDFLIGLNSKILMKTLRTLRNSFFFVRLYVHYHFHASKGLPIHHRVYVWDLRFQVILGVQLSLPLRVEEVKDCRIVLKVAVVGVVRDTSLKVLTEILEVGEVQLFAILARHQCHQ